MKLSDGKDEYQIIPMCDGPEWWIAIAKNDMQIGNPSITATELADLIKELKNAFYQMIE